MKALVQQRETATVHFENKVLVKDIASSTELAVCHEKPLLVYGHNSFSTVIVRDDALGKLQNFKSGEISDNAWPRINLE